MNSIIVAWARSNNLERHVPLLFSARRNRRLGSGKSFHLVLLEGIDLLSPGYRRELKEAGYILHDASGVYSTLKLRYAELERFGDYERKCFLRWLVIREIFGDAPFVHYDGDIIFNALPEELEDTYRGLTFILQGCPAFTHVQDSSWLASYQSEFQRYYDNMEAYSAHAWHRRDDFLQTFKARNSGLWDRKLISSDQDLLQFLTLDRRLQQDDADALHQRGELALFQNPISIARDISMSLPLSYKRVGGMDYLNGRKVALWHMQSDFSDYLGCAVYRKQLSMGGRVQKRQNAQIGPLGYRVLRKVFHMYTREWLYKRFFEEGEDLSFLLNAEMYWQEGVFA